METIWTIDSLRDLIIHLFEELDKRYQQRFEDAKTAVDIAFSAQKESVQSALLSAERAVLKAEGASEKRFDAVNEFRSTLADQQRTLMPRAEAEIIFKSLSDRIREISNTQKLKEGEKIGSHDTFAWIIACVSFIITLITIIINFLKK